MKADEVQRALECSRPFGVAEDLVGRRVDREAVLARTVVLSAGEGVLTKVEAQWCMVDSLRLLSRVVGKLEVVLPDDAPTSFVAAVNDAVEAVWSQGTVKLVSASGANWSGATSVLCIHAAHNRAPTATVVGSDGWIAYVGARPHMGVAAGPNAMAALMAASIGAAEVFKQVYGVPHEIAPPLGNEYFNLFTGDDSDPEQGPGLPVDIELPDALLLGAGAIGNAIASLLTRLRPQGRLVIVDKDVFAPENRGTCMLLDRDDWVGQPKADTLAKFLEGSEGLSVKGWKGRIEDASGADGVDLSSIDLVFGALDDVSARRAVQKLWPSVLVDGAINARGATSIARRFVDADVACLRCTFPEPKKKVSDLTSDERRLHANRKAICAQLDGEATQEAFGLDLEDGFRPSVPFVASASAAMVVAQSLKAVLWPEKRLAHQLQIESLFLGFSTAQKLRRATVATCECVKRRELILGVIAARLKGGRSLTT